MCHNWLTILLSLSLFLSCRDDLKLRGENCNALVLCSYHVLILVSFMYIIIVFYVCSTEHAQCVASLRIYNNNKIIAGSFSFFVRFIYRCEPHI